MADADEIDEEQVIFPQQVFVAPKVLKLKKNPVINPYLQNSLFRKIQEVAALQPSDDTVDDRRRIANAIPVFSGFHYISCHAGDIKKKSCLLNDSESNHARYRLKNKNTKP